MRFDLSEPQRQIQELCRAFAGKGLRPRAAAIDREDAFPRDLSRRLAALDLLGMTLPPEPGAPAPTPWRGGWRRRSSPAAARPWPTPPSSPSRWAT